jgi:hypothetical protein
MLREFAKSEMSTETKIGFGFAKSGPASAPDLLVAWLRDCAARIARENRADLRPVYGQLRIINKLAREVLASARDRQVITSSSELESGLFQ